MTKLLFSPYKGYRGTAEFSEEDGVFWGKIHGIMDLMSYESDILWDLEKEFKDAVDAYLADCKAVGKVPDKPGGKSLENLEELAEQFSLGQIEVERLLVALAEKFPVEYMSVLGLVKMVEVEE